MRRGLALWGVAILLPMLHFLLRVGVGIGGWAPDLLTIGLLVTARQVKPEVGAGLGFLFGLLEDSLSTLSFGANTIALTVVGFLGGRSRELFVGESFVFLASYLALGAWLRLAIHWLIAGGRVWADAPDVLLVQGGIAAVYAATVGSAILVVTGAWERV